MSKGVLWKTIWQKRLDQLHQHSQSYFQNSRKRKFSWSKFFPRFTLGLFVFLVIGTVLIGVVLAIFSYDLPSPDKIVRQEGFATKIYDRNNKLIYDVFKKEKRTPVTFDKIPLYLKQATIAIEDKDFYKHQGFDVKGWMRIFYYLVSRRRLIGGSTLTQQLIKNVLLTKERTITRKIREFILALQIESKYKKDEILLMYLNETSYGGNSSGVEEAAEMFFGKTVSDLNLVESAIISGLAQNPPYYSPLGHEPKAYIARTTEVLRRMHEDNYITVEQEKEAVALLPEVKFNKTEGTLKAPHFVMYVKKLLEDKYGTDMVEQGGLRVWTTLDLDFQEKMQATLSAEIAKVEKVHITNGAAVVMDPQNGQILAMIGSKNYDDPNYDGKVNVTTSLRQPGSAIKPVTYLTALQQGYTLSTLLMDVKTPFPNGDKPDYIPENYDNKDHGPVQVRYALGNSFNISAVKMLAMVGVKPMMKTAFEMGLSTLEPTEDNLKRVGLSVTLGGGEVRLVDLVSAYSAFANGGLKVKPTVFLKITDKDGNLLQEDFAKPLKRVMTAEDAFLISNTLSDNKARLITFSENNLLAIPNRQVAVKTGTTNDKRDNWTIGWTPQIMVGVWVGNNDNSAMLQLASGVSGAAPIWRKIIMDYLKDKPKLDFITPENIITSDVDVISGYKAHDSFPLRTEFFKRGTDPQGDDPVHTKMKVCKSSGKIATIIDVARGDFEEKEYFEFKEENPTAGESQSNRWQEAILKWVASQSDSKYRPPTEFCETQNPIEVRISDPQDHSQLGSKFTIKIEPIALNDIIKIEIYVDGNLKETLTTSPFERDLSLTDGTHTLKAKAYDSKGNANEKEAKIGVNVPWDHTPPTPTPVPPTPTPIIPTATPPLPTPTT